MELHHLKSAIVHHWFLVHTGGERVCESLCSVLNKPDLFALVCNPKTLTPILNQCTVTTSLVQKLPRSLKWYRNYAVLYPLAVELLDLGGYDLVISSDASVMKGVITQPETCHICYCHSPMRYAWNMFHEYKNQSSWIKRVVFTIVMHYLRMHDQCGADRVDYFVANSENTRRRILKYYRREAKVIYPPCETDRFTVSKSVDGYYLFVSRLVDYKRADVAIQAFTELRRPLLVIGDGPAKGQLKSMAGRNIEFLGWVPDKELARLYSKCTAVVYPAEEDFGIVPVEAQASGRPVVAYGKGGALETVVDGKTGVFFYQQTSEALKKAVGKLERNLQKLDPEATRMHALQFGKERFISEMGSHSQWCVEDHQRRLGLGNLRSG